MDVSWSIYNIHYFTNRFCNSFISDAVVFLSLWMDYQKIITKITVRM
jgi:hypothetical protein